MVKAGGAKAAILKGPQERNAGTQSTNDDKHPSANRERRSDWS
jgi:hypothetical protein